MTHLRLTPQQPESGADDARRQERPVEDAGQDPTADVTIEDQRPEDVDEVRSAAVSRLERFEQERAAGEGMFPASEPRHEREHDDERTADPGPSGEE